MTIHHSSLPLCSLQTDLELLHPLQRLRNEAVNGNNEKIKRPKGKKQKQQKTTKRKMGPRAGVICDLWQFGDA